MPQYADALSCPDCGARLTLAGWSLHTPAWCVVNLDELLSGPETRGESPLYEQQHGRPGRNRMFEETEYLIPMVFGGRQDRLGVAYADPTEGLMANLRAFRNQIVTAELIAGELEFDIPVDDTAVDAGECIAERLEWEQQPGAVALASLRLVIPTPWETVTS